MEVINRLEAIAGLAPLEPAEAAKASFVSPALVGRAAEVELTFIDRNFSGRLSAILTGHRDENR